MKLLYNNRNIYIFYVHIVFYLIDIANIKRYLRIFRADKNRKKHDVFIFKAFPRSICITNWCSHVKKGNNESKFRGRKFFNTFEKRKKRITMIILLFLGTFFIVMYFFLFSYAYTLVCKRILEINF